MGGTVLAVAAVVEFATGLALIGDPALVVSLLLGLETSNSGTLLGRCFGIALVALAIACWPARGRTGFGVAAWRAMVVYNALIALFLGYLSTVGHLSGVLLWPAIALHAVVAMLLLWTPRTERRTKTFEERPR